MTLTELFDLAVSRKATEIHLATGESPRLRIAGELVTLDAEATPDDALDPDGRARLAMGLPAEREIVHGDFVFSGVAFRTLGDGVAVTFRLLPKGVPPFERIMEGAEGFFGGLAERRWGLVVVSGPTGSGKTTTALTLVDRINAERAARILVVSHGASHVFENRRGFVSHLRVEDEREGYARAIRVAFQASADVVTTDDLPTYEDLRQALLLAEAGALVVANLHAPTAAEAIVRLLDAAGDEAPALRRALADNLVAVTGQRLAPRIGGGKTPIYEWIANGPAVQEALLSGGDLAQVQASDPGSRALRPIVLDTYMSGKISLEDAYQIAPKEPLVGRPD